MGNETSVAIGHGGFSGGIQTGFNGKFVVSHGDLLVSLTRSSSEYIVRKTAESVEEGLIERIQKSWDIPAEEFSIGKKIGAGSYGVVFKGTLKKQDVAIKMAKVGQVTVEDFKAEAKIMQQCQHENLVQLMAVCYDQTAFYIITEFMENGSLLDYMKTETGQALELDQMIRIAAQIANGMTFLERKRIVHRDLAARNVLVGQHQITKVADFGLARLLSPEDDFYTPTKSKFPVKWTAPEGFDENEPKFTTKSDVWSFGIVLIEIVTRGNEPYPGIQNSEIGRKIKRGYRQQKPENCPEELYDLAISCWHEIPARRPDFKFIHATLKSMNIH